MRISCWIHQNQGTQPNGLIHPEQKPTIGLPTSLLEPAWPFRGSTVREMQKQGDQRPLTDCCEFASFLIVRTKGMVNQPGGPLAKTGDRPASPAPSCLPLYLLQATAVVFKHDQNREKLFRTRLARSVLRDGQQSLCESRIPPPTLFLLFSSSRLRPSPSPVHVPAQVCQHFSRPPAMSFCCTSSQ
uniref:Uncharacterized protein n=1 Tax=Coccidioides posadasii RMSCC 3488 TaxID=454284 RepID=A0A0J6FBZ4_COCPO|nr:hypothetical protein CPAG_04121 [Coccidioides posadasii RMSCC 3488]